MTSKFHQTEPEMTRRQFIRRTTTTLGIAAGTGILGRLAYSEVPVRKPTEKIYTFKNYRVPITAQNAAMAVIQGTTPEKMIRAGIDSLGGIRRFIQKGDKVLIKPNVGWDRQPEQAANTNPEVVAAAVALCLEAGAADVWVTDVSINDPHRSFARSGIEAATRKAGGRIRIPSESDFVPTDLKGKALQIWPVSRFYHEADKVINIPIVKQHSLSGCTISMKNWYGILGGRRSHLHQDIHTSIADLASAVKPTLTIVDATRVLVRNGPTGGSLEDVSIQNTLVMGLDEVALDTYSLKFLGLTDANIPYLEIAEKNGLGVRNFQSLHPVTLTTA